MICPCVRTHASKQAPLSANISSVNSMTARPGLLLCIGTIHTKFASHNRSSTTSGHHITFHLSQIWLLSHHIRVVHAASVCKTACAVHAVHAVQDCLCYACCARLLVLCMLCKTACAMRAEHAVQDCLCYACCARCARLLVLWYLCMLCPLSMLCLL